MLVLQDRVRHAQGGPNAIVPRRGAPSNDENLVTDHNVHGVEEALSVAARRARATRERTTRAAAVERLCAPYTLYGTCSD